MSDFRFVRAFKKNDAKLEQDAIDTWRHYGILPPNTMPEERAKELCVVAYAGEEVAGVSTLTIAAYAPLRKRFGFFRAFTVPKFGNQNVARNLAIECRLALNDWALENPDEQIAGMMAIFEARGAGSHPVDKSGLMLIGYNSEGAQMRVVWFDHVTIPV
jgi:hypothetical protein